MAEQVVQLCLIVAFDLFFDLALAAFGNGIFLAMTVPEATFLRFEWLQL